jgi:hypothetical protein
MSGAAPRIHQEFWRPPAAQETGAAPGGTVSAHVCSGCGTEFMLGAHYCYVCGTARAVNPVADHGWVRYLEFHNIKEALGLPMPSLIAFLVGIGCLLAALFLGVVYTIRNLSDFQAVQLWRMQWLLGAVAAFVAGILLKASASRQN